MIYGIIRSFLWLRNPDFGSPSIMAIGIIALWVLFLWFVWIILLGIAILYAIGIPHYFLYVKDKHRSSYLYLVKYLSAIPIVWAGIWIVISILQIFSGNFSSSILINMGWALLLGIPFSILFIFTNNKSRKSFGYEV